MKLYDTLSKSKKELKPITNNRVGIFVCGPTVYDYSHIGHARTYVAFDAFVKYLVFKGFSVRYIQNITDIDDKIITRAQELKQNPRDLAANFEKEYFHDMESLNIDSVDKYARATDYILQIISQVSRLIDMDFAYKTSDGIYYDISKFKYYGKLSGRTAEQAEDAVSRIDESVNKKNKGDFALWKFSKPNEPTWQSPWGDGRPGWHIEDTAITESELGDRYDIHGGARDLIFPHHESEIAQMEAISQKEPLVNFWMHTGFLTVNGEKMSKSLGNFVTIHELLRKYSKETFRLFILSSHYRSPIDYKESALEQAKANIERIKEFYEKLSELANDKLEKHASNEFSNAYIKSFYSELDDDFNTPKALAILFELIREINSKIAEGKLRKSEASSLLEFLDNLNSIFDITEFIQFTHIKSKTAVPIEISELAAERDKLRNQKKWADADEIRKKIENLGYVIEDKKGGPNIKSKKNP